MNITYTQNGDYLIPNIIIRKTKPSHWELLRKFMVWNQPNLIMQMFCRHDACFFCHSMDICLYHNSRLISLFL